MNCHYLQAYSGIRVSRNYSEHADLAGFERHCHRSYELIYILQGAGKYIVEGIEYPMHPHALLFMQPREYHYARPEPSTPYERVVIHFDGAGVPEKLLDHPILNEQHGNYFPLGAGSHPIRSVYEMMDNIVPLAGEDGTGSNAQAEAFVRATLVQILSLLTLETPEQTISADSETILRVIDYLNQHLTEEISLDTLAKEFFISKYHLSRLFHAQIGTSIFNYINTKKIVLAQGLLAEGENANAVAFRLGYRDYSTFYRAYRKQTGESPVRKIEKEL